MLPGLFCKHPPSGNRNFDLEETVANVLYPCPFGRLVRGNCDLTFYLSDMAQHVRDSHPFACLERTGDSAWIQLPLGVMEYGMVLFNLGELFFVQFAYNTEYLQFRVFHVGIKKDYSGYKCKFIIENYPLIFDYDFTCHNYLQDMNEVSWPGLNLSMSPETVNFFNNSIVSYSFRIETVEVEVPCNIPRRPTGGMEEMYNSDVSLTTTLVMGRGVNATPRPLYS